VLAAGYGASYGSYVLQLSRGSGATEDFLAGDSNRDGQFNQLDIVQVLLAAKYNSDQPAGWSEGDWSGDGRFDQMDIIAALQTGRYLQGPAPARRVPEMVPPRSGEPDAIDRFFAQVDDRASR
jgi:hypothetical protein